MPRSAALASPQPHRLPVLLQLRDELVALFDHIGVLLILVIGSVRLDDALDAVDGARDPIRGDELGEIPGRVLAANGEDKHTIIMTSKLTGRGSRQ